MRKLNVLMLGWEFPPVINGGLGIACLGIAKALSNHVNLSIILPKSDPEFIVNNVELLGLNNINLDDLELEETRSLYDEFSEVDEIDTEIIPYQSTDKFDTTILGTTIEKISKKLHKKVLDQFKSGDIYGEDVINKVIQFSKYAAVLAKKKDFDVIHAHDWMTFLAGIEIKKQSGKPLVLHVHALDYDRGGPDSRGWIYDVEKYGMENADAIIPVSHYTGTIVRDHYGIDENKIFPVHNGADPVEVYHEKKLFPEKLVLFLGRITGQKGPENFLEVADKVIKEHKKVRFVMAGTGDKMKRIIETGAYHHVGNKFHFTGFLTRDKVNRLLAMADVYCMPSVSEPFGLSALEAAQFGIPAVISKQSGAAEVLDGALKADYWDVNLMAEHICTLLDDDEAKEKVVQENYKALKNLTWEKAADKIVHVFQKVTS